MRYVLFSTNQPSYDCNLVKIPGFYHQIIIIIITWVVVARYFRILVPVINNGYSSWACFATTFKQYLPSMCLSFCFSSKQQQLYSKRTTLNYVRFDRSYKYYIEIQHCSVCSNWFNVHHTQTMAAWGQSFSLRVVVVWSALVWLTGSVRNVFNNYRPVHKLT